MQTRTATPFFAALLIALLLVGCASLEPQHNRNLDKLEVGMTQARLTQTLGAPNKINRSGRGLDQYIYNGGQPYPRVYVYVQDGIVRDYQIQQ